MGAGCLSSGFVLSDPTGAFTLPELYICMEEETYYYVVRLKGNDGVTKHLNGNIPVFIASKNLFYRYMELFFTTLPKKKGNRVCFIP